MQVNRDQIREIVKEEFYKILFEKRIFETEIRAYIKSLIFEDMHGLRMIVKCKINNNQSEFVISEDAHNFTLFEKKENVDIKKLYDQYLKGRFVECSYDSFFKAMNFIYDPGQINWIQKSNNNYTYVGIFDLYSEVYHIDYNNMDKFKKKRFQLYICSKFKKGGQAITEKNLNNAYLRYKQNLNNLK